MSITFNKESQERLASIRKKEEEELTVILSQKYGLAYIDLTKTEISTAALQLISEKNAKAAEIATFAIKNKMVSVGIRTPNTSVAQKEMEKIRELGYKVTPYMVSTASLERAWGHYSDISFAPDTESGVLDVSSDEVSKLMKELTSLQATRDAIAKTTTSKKVHHTSRILEIIIAGALANGASDIHIEPEDGAVRIRYRLDGVLTNAAEIDHETYRPILIRIKLISGLKINVKNSAQDGRFSVRMGEKEIEIRTSILPGNYGESIVTRLLDPSSIGVPLESLGMSSSLLDVLLKEIKRPNGMILNTGPTGSGKTTTLYAFLKKVQDPGIKILTIEDPIEYHVEGIVQTQVNHKDYTFSSGLRAALRQDPDIIMVGEIRDEEVASTAVHAALTGHLVFSTLHTNNAAGAYARLVDIGVDPSILGSAVNCVMAQRLVRTLRPEYRKEMPITGEDRVFIDTILDGIKDRSLIPENTDTMWVPDTPEGEIEYKGRVGVYEVVLTTREIEDAVRKHVTMRELDDVARQQGLLSLHEDAVLKVLNGTTTLSELHRVLGDTLNTN